MAYKAIETGFTGAVMLLCSDRDMQQVNADDGCTFGLRGSQSWAKADAPTELGGYAAVNGWLEAD